MLALSHITIPYPHLFDESSDAGSDAASEETLDDFQSPYLVGAPLSRMVKYEYLSVTSTPSSDDYSSEDPTEYFVREEEINYIEEDMSMFDLRLNGGDGEGPEGDPLLRTTSLTYVRSVVDHMAANPPVPSPQISLTATPAHPSHPLLVRHLPSTSKSTRELALWRYLNSSAIRRDPWNPSPPALSVIERELAASAADRLAHIVEFGTETDRSDGEAYVVMDRLWALPDNPLMSTGDVVDFSRQMLQGLVFLHEHNITQAMYTLPHDTSSKSIMMDIGLAPPHTRFSRSEFPVKYYLLDFTKALRLRINAPPIPRRSSRAANPRGRPNNTVVLSASRARVPSILPKTYFGSLKVGIPSVYTTHGLPRGRARSDSDVSIVSSGPNSPPDGMFDMGTPKQPQFFSRPGSPDAFSDPEPSDDESSEGDEEDGVRAVSPATRTSLFATDLRNLADMLQGVIQISSPASEALTPVLAAMRQAKALSLSAEDALRLFESAVRSFNVATVAA